MTSECSKFRFYFYININDIISIIVSFEDGKGTKNWNVENGSET
jgi:hypothetical protein